ncbi:hypothetical protein BEWA_023900 [Theileria equi strain WA]|uniref:Pseudouridine synthase RsuA/RluA-like domain-containing protein n=1 Tax=Theileria equi strain WA TaxID=1537102 RepID=L0AWZ1_THEEQ|nr:hypothetical protein BEWA_023900 [Theileria equi strain WA]AFZ79541.1 hypothetical protein BEWA_023900 [Theileria equi strain WA]|eukprot:XP_004829207.1 hypothetical protein BEWA_023900 [Theileria equi strain WA]
MASAAQEIRILFKGPGDRLFVTYKPLGWYLSAPPGKTKCGNSLAAIIAAKLGFTAECIKFSSKLGLNQRGLVIGATDDGMYNQLNRYVEQGLCTKTYKCIIRANNMYNVWSDGEFPMKQALKRFSYRYGSSEGTINFHLHKCPDTLSLRSLGNDLGNYIRLGSSKTKSQFISKSSAVYARVCKEDGPHRMEYRITNLRDHLRKLMEEENIEMPKGVNYSQFRLLEIKISDNTVDRHLLEIMSSLGIDPVGMPSTRLKFLEHVGVKHYQNGLLMELCEIELPHPIYKMKTIQVRMSNEDFSKFLHLLNH